MRLLRTTELKLEEFQGDDIPTYAILSHTWDQNEILFEQLGVDAIDQRRGYEKLKNACRRAAADGFSYIWIDTCCIDKKSSAELSEAINSMYRWYKDSTVCYAYLTDVSCRGNLGTRPFAKSRWFERGWTLQELIAPEVIIFLDQEWQEMGTKASLQEEISNITGISTNILLGGDLESASIAQRMSWASQRFTTRLEDIAYCLMGIFGVNMPLLYGEGQRAFIRLQEEILKASDDHSIFSWEVYTQSPNILATSPWYFSGSSDIVPVNPTNTRSRAITVNNQGVHLKLPILDNMTTENTKIALLPCTKRGERVAILVEAISDKGDYFMRADDKKLKLLNPSEAPGDLSKYIARDLCFRQAHRKYQGFPRLAQHAQLGDEKVVKFLLEKGANIEAKTVGGTSLVLAVVNGHEAVVRKLLEKGANIESEDRRGRTPLSWAVEMGHRRVVRILLEKGANIESKDKLGRTPLSVAVKIGHRRVVRILLEKGANIESKDNFSRTPLSLAVDMGHESVVRILLENGANIGPGSTLSVPLLLEAKDRDIVRMLREER